jgi:uncharacterized phage protein gp47/JayE
MIDVGHPFSRPFRELVESLEESVREGVEQSALADILFRRDTAAYELPGPVHDVWQVTGVRRRESVTFERNVHYRYGAGRLVWLPPPTAGDPAWYPDDNSRLTVEYTYRDLPSGITDFNAGSVAGTLVRAFAREMKFLYEQMDQAYRRAFIDVAQGEALDNVVALLGISRNRPLPARGFVTFFLKRVPRDRVVIPARTRVADAKGVLFAVAQAGAVEPVLEEPVRQAAGIVRTANRIGALVHVRVRGSAADLPTKPTAPGKPFGADERTVTLNGVAPPDELIVRYSPVSVTLPVVAMEPGRGGNLGSGSLAVMPTPPRGVDGGVTNEQPTTGGEEAESDEQLRERAKHELERAGKATLNALRYSILEVDGVEGVEVRDHATDESIPLGEVRVRYSGGNEAHILAAIEENRAAGIVVRAEAITTVFISGTLYVIPDAGFADDSTAQLRKRVVEALSGLAIGEAAYVRRFAAMAYQVPGLADVAEARLDYARRPPGQALPSETGVVADPFIARASELVRPDEGQLTVVALRGLQATGAYVAAGTRTDLTVRVLKEDGLPAAFRSFRLNVTVTVRARLKTEPGQPPQRVAQVEAQLQFTNADTAVLSVANAAILDVPGRPGYRLGPEGHDPAVEFQVTASAYPALRPGLAPVTLGIS